MCRAGSNDRLRLTLPAWTSAGETSTVAGGSAGVPAAPGPEPNVDEATIDDGLATGLAETPGAEAGAAALVDAHAVAASKTVEKIDKRSSCIWEYLRVARMNARFMAAVQA